MTRPLPWVDAPDGGVSPTPIDAASLNDLEASITGKLDAALAGANNGVATLDNAGDVPLAQIPDLSATYVPVATKAVANGVATLDTGTKVPLAQIPSLSATYVPVATKAVANGVATLDTGTKVPFAQIPDLSTTYLAIGGKGVIYAALGTDMINIGRQRYRPSVDSNYSAFPSVTLLNDGRLFMVWRQGTDHAASVDGVIKGSYSSDKGLTWTTATTVMSLVGTFDLRDPCISTSNDLTKIYLTYFKATAALAAAGSFFRFSTDNGITWSMEKRIDTLAYCAITAPIVQLSTGTLLAVMYGKTLTSDARDSVWTSTSTNGGTTWTTQVNRANGVTAGLDMQEPWADAQGTNVVVMHRYGNAANIGMFISTNTGSTYGASTVEFAGSGRPSFAITTAGTIVCVYRNLAGDQHALLRSSGNLGGSWTQPKLLEYANPNFWTYSHPFEVARGQIIIPTTVENTSTLSVISIRYAMEGGGVSPFGDVSPTVVERASGRSNTVAVVDTFDRYDSTGVGYSENGMFWYGSSTPMINNGSLLNTNSTSSDLIYANAETPDVEIECEFMWTGNAGVYIVYRLQSGTDYWMAGIETNGTAARIYKVVGGTATQVGTTGTVACPAGYWFKLRLTSVGGNHRFFVEDELKTFGTDGTGNFYPWVGLRTGGNVAGTGHRVRNYIVRRRTGFSS